MAEPFALIPPTQWMHMICDRDGTDAVEVTNAYEKKTNLPLKRLPTASGRVRLDHPLIDRIMTGDVLLKSYRKSGVAGSSWQLKFEGPVLTCEESASREEQVMQYNAVGGFWYIAQRLLGKSSSGYAYGTAGLLKKRTEIATDILQQANNSGFTGIALGTITNPGEPSDAHYGPVTYSPAGDALTELCAALGSFEWEVTPNEPVTPTGQTPLPDGSLPKRIGLFNMTYPQWGTGAGNTLATKNNVIFEYGAQTPQVLEYKRTISRDSLLTQCFILPPGWPTSNAAGTTVSAVRSTNASGALAARGLVEGVVPSDLVADDLRLFLANAHINTRQAPRQLVTFTLAPNAVPRAFDSFGNGDRVRARAVYNGIVRFDAMFRVWGISATSDAAGNEMVELELQEPA